MYLFSIHEDLALRRCQHAKQHLHQGRFSRAVFADEGMDLTLFDLQIDIMVCHNAARIDFCDVPGL